MILESAATGSGVVLIVLQNKRVGSSTGVSIWGGWGGKGGRLIASHSSGTHVERGQPTNGPKATEEAGRGSAVLERLWAHPFRG